FLEPACVRSHRAVIRSRGAILSGRGAFLGQACHCKFSFVTGPDGGYSPEAVIPAACRPFLTPPGSYCRVCSLVACGPRRWSSLHSSPLLLLPSDFERAPQNLNRPVDVAGIIQVHAHPARLRQNVMGICLSRGHQLVPNP